ARARARNAHRLAALWVRRRLAAGEDGAGGGEHALSLDGSEGQVARASRRQVVERGDVPLVAFQGIVHSGMRLGHLRSLIFASTSTSPESETLPTAIDRLEIPRALASKAVEAVIAALA